MPIFHDIKKKFIPKKGDHLNANYIVTLQMSVQKNVKKERIKREFYRRKIRLATNQSNIECNSLIYLVRDVTKKKFSSSIYYQ